MHAYRYDGLEALGASHVWDPGRRCDVCVWVEEQHAEADEGVAEEDCDGEQNHDEEDVNFLAEGAVCKGDC